MSKQIKDIRLGQVVKVKGQGSLLWTVIEKPDFMGDVRLELLVNNGILCTGSKTRLYRNVDNITAIGE